MTTFDEREQAFERKYVHDQEQLFRADARRTRMLGEWAAEKLGLPGDEAAAYAHSLLQVDLDTPGDAEVIARLRSDFDNAGVVVGDAAIRAKSAEFMAIAITQVRSGVTAGALQ